jgi:hypothetical protein
VQNCSNDGRMIGAGVHHQLRTIPSKMSNSALQPGDPTVRVSNVSPATRRDEPRRQMARPAPCRLDQEISS